MSELIKTEAIVLRKLDYGDSSRIIHLFTEEFGKLTAIVKGARSSKSKYGLSLDTINYVQIIFYKKDTRDVQLIKEADLINHFTVVKENLDRIQCASSIIELISNLTVEHEVHKKLFTGTVKALELMNNPEKDPKLIFAKYFLFFIREIGYALSYDACSVCGRPIHSDENVAFNYDSGIVCKECKSDRLVHVELNKELFNLFICLNLKKNDIKYDQKSLGKIIQLIEKFLKYNLQEFKGIKSLELI
ncbi:MAG: DNA repair protein RecO [Melioribacter sp.]|nr:DNA repair protein RecO [Melioribacter sp.]